MVGPAGPPGPPGPASVASSDTGVAVGGIMVSTALDFGSKHYEARSVVAC